MAAKIQAPTYKRTPDLVAGPIIGHGSPKDFFIDVTELKGGKPWRLQDPKSPRFLSNPLAHPFTIYEEDIPVGHFPQYQSTLEGKLRKYSTERDNSPMVGMCTYLDVSAVHSDATIRPYDLLRFFMRIDYLRFLKEFFQMNRWPHTIPAVNLLWKTETPVVVFLPFRHRFTFLLHCVKLPTPLALRTLLVVNDPLLDDRGTYHGSPILEWLRTIRGNALRRN